MYQYQVRTYLVYDTSTRYSYVILSSPKGGHGAAVTWCQVCCCKGYCCVQGYQGTEQGQVTAGKSGKA